MPYLGVGFAPNSTLITSVVPKGPADKADLMPGDKLLKLDGAKVATLEQVRQALGKHKPGDKIDVEVQRGGKALTIHVEIGSQATDE